MKMKDVMTKAVLTSLSVAAVSTVASVPAYAAEGSFEFTGESYSTKGWDYSFTKNEDGSYNLEGRAGDVIYLGYSATDSRLSIDVSERIGDAEDITAGSDSKFKYVMVHLNLGDGGTVADIKVRPRELCTVENPDGRFYGNEVLIHVKIGMNGEYLHMPKDVNPYLREDVDEGFLEKLNQRRAQLGLSPVTLSDDLHVLANRRAMEVKDNFVHTMVDGYGEYTESLIVTNEGEARNAYDSGFGSAFMYTNHTGSRADAENPNIKEIGVSQYVLGKHLAITVVIAR